MCKSMLKASTSDNSARTSAASQQLSKQSANTNTTAIACDPNATINRPDGRSLLADALEKSGEFNVVGKNVVGKNEQIDADDVNKTAEQFDTAQLQTEVSLLKEALAERDHAITELKSRVYDMPDLKAVHQDEKSEESSREQDKLTEQLEQLQQKQLHLSRKLHLAEADVDAKRRHLATWLNRTRKILKQSRQQRTIIGELRKQLKLNSQLLARQADKVIDIDTDKTNIDTDKTNEVKLLFEVPSDDLQAMRGIGPALEKRLNKQGIYCFRQIAAMSLDDLVELGKTLGVGRNRTLCSEWLSQAQEITGAGDAADSDNKSAESSVESKQHQDSDEQPA